MGAPKAMRQRHCFARKRLRRLEKLSFSRTFGPRAISANSFAIFSNLRSSNRHQTRNGNFGSSTRNLGRVSKFLLFRGSKILVLQRSTCRLGSWPVNLIERKTMPDRTVKLRDLRDDHRASRLPLNFVTCGQNGHFGGFRESFQTN